MLSYFLLYEGFMSNNQDKLKITYKPDLDYEKNYDTIGFANHNINSDQSDNITDSSISDYNTIRIEDIKSSISEINAFIVYLPTEIATIVFDLNTCIKSTLPYIKDLDKSKANTSNENNNSINNNTNNSNNDNDSINNNTKSNMSNGKIINLPSSSLDSDVIYAPQKIDTKKSNTLVDAFDYLTLTIYDNYLSNLKNGLVTYQMNIALANQMNTNIAFNNNDEYNANTSSVDLNQKHLSDNIIRSEYIYDQKTRLLSKMFSVKNALAHFKSVYASKHFCDRYESESPVRNERNRQSKFIRDTWLATKAAYYKKYCNSVADMYKYYDSCADLISDCLNIKAQSYVARTILNK